MAARIFGWKAIVLFCIGIIAGIAFISLFIPTDPSVQTLPEELFLQAQAMRLNATQNDWQANVEANKDDDGKLASIVEDSLKDQVYEAAITAAGLIQKPELKDKALTEIFTKASSACETLPWAALSLSDMDLKSDQLHKSLNDKWAECKKSAGAAK